MKYVAYIFQGSNVSQKKQVFQRERKERHPPQTDLSSRPRSQIFSKMGGVASDVFPLCVSGIKLISAPLPLVLDNFFDIKRFFLKAVTVVGGSLLRRIMCYVKRVPLHYSASNLALYFFSLLLNSSVEQSWYDNRRNQISFIAPLVRHSWLRTIV